MDAREFLLDRNYKETVKLPDDKIVSPSFGWSTVIRLMEEYAALKVKMPTDEEVKERASQQAHMYNKGSSFVRGFKLGYLSCYSWLKSKLQKD